MSCDEKIFAPFSQPQFEFSVLAWVCSPEALDPHCGRGGKESQHCASNPGRHLRHGPCAKLLQSDFVGLEASMTDKVDAKILSVVVASLVAADATKVDQSDLDLTNEGLQATAAQATSNGMRVWERWTRA
jgi:hypothetical protein